MDGTIARTIASEIAKYAPVLASALGSPAGAIVLALIAKALNVKDVEIIDKLKKDPAAADALEKLEMEHHEALIKLANEHYATEVTDRQNARSREVAVRDHMTAIIAIAFIVIYTIIQLYVLRFPTNADDIISARVQDIIIMIISYYFGSVHRAKDLK